MALTRHGEAPELVLDLSRLLSRVHHGTPTGVDRVEMAYAGELLRLAGDRLSFAAVHPVGLYGRLDRRAVTGFLDRTRHAWDRRDRGALTHAERVVLTRTLWTLRPRPIPRASRRRVLIQSSPHHLHREALVGDILRREQARFICMVHDLIPITFPEYARPGGAALHRRRLATIARHAAGIVTNSAATRDDLQRLLGEHGASILVAHLGLTQPAAVPPAVADGRPYFVCVGTIEPRKNHLLLLHLWRQMATVRGGPPPPRLVIIGRRGWENEQVVDLLERCPSLAPSVEEIGRVSDCEMTGLLAGAAALLLPSFAEGFGMPVPEALALNVPVLCSDLPALREAGGEVPEYLDPLDGPAWLAAIRDYADPGSRRRLAQIARLATWRPTSWGDHLASVLDLAERIG